MEQYMTFVWLGIAVALGILEICTSQLVCIWFVVGAFVTAVCTATFLSDSVIWQIVIFLLVSAVALVLTRPLVKKLKRFDKTHTNSDRNIGKTGKVLIEINRDNSTGLVEVDGERWTARATDGSVIPEGTYVKVDSIQGVKLMVTPVKNNNSEV